MNKKRKPPLERSKGGGAEKLLETVALIRPASGLMSRTPPEKQCSNEILKRDK